MGNKLIDSVIDSTLLCELKTQITFSPEQLDSRVPLGPFLTLSSLGSFGFRLGSFGFRLGASLQIGVFSL